MVRIPVLASVRLDLLTCEHCRLGDQTVESERHTANILREDAGGQEPVAR